MRSLIQTYSFKYLRPEQIVYPIVKKPPNDSLSSTQFLSQPIKQNNIVINSLVSYVCPSQANIVCKYSDATTYPMALTEFEYISKVLGLPSIVIVNSLCQLEHSDDINEQYELFFSSASSQNTPLCWKQNQK